MTEWRVCIENDNYEVSDEGQVRRHTAGRGTYPGRILRLKCSKQKKHWYYRIGLTKGDITTDYSVHTLVCSAFNGPAPSPKHEVAHIDGDPHNNAASNLRWATPRENHADKIRHGTLLEGERCYNTKISDQDVANIRLLGALAVPPSQREIAELFGITQSYVGAILRREKRRNRGRLMEDANAHQS